MTPSVNCIACGGCFLALTSVNEIRCYRIAMIRLGKHDGLGGNERGRPEAPARRGGASRGVGCGVSSINFFFNLVHRFLILLFLKAYSNA